MSILERLRRMRSAIRRRLLVAGWLNVDARSVVVQADVFHVRFVHGGRVLAMPVAEVDSVDCQLLPDCLERWECLLACVNSRRAAFRMDLSCRSGEELRTALQRIPGLRFDALRGAEKMLGAGPFTFQIYKAPESGR